MKSKILLSTFLVFIIGNLFAQREILESKDEVVILAKKNLDNLLKTEKFQKKLTKEDVHGSYTFKITVNDKGRISSMRALDRSEDASIPGQNFLNNLVRKHKLKFRIPKGKSYQFNYTFITP
jgi:hypothetical protein